MKPQSLDVATDYRLAVLWMMDHLESAHASEATAAFWEEFSPIIPSDHREATKSGRIKWERHVALSRFELVRVGLMGSGGRGVWTITPAGEAWLIENPNAHAADLAAFIRQAGAEAQSGFRWRGKHYGMTKRALFSRARRLLEDGPPKEALRFRDWAVFVGEQPVSVKWLFALATGAQYDGFSSRTARRVLSQIGIEARRVGEGRLPGVADKQDLRGPTRIRRRDDFFAAVAQQLRTRLPVDVSHGKIKVSPGRNLLQVTYREFAGAHYELRLARAFDEFAFHLESSREKNLARLAHVEAHLEELAIAVGHPVLAAPWGSNWARLAIEFPPGSWESAKPEEYASLLGRFIEVTHGLLHEAYRRVPAGRRRPTERTDSEAAERGRPYAILSDQINQIRLFLQGRSVRPSDELLCDWVQFCYTFELFGDGYELFNLIVPSAVNDWLYGRTKRLAQVCRMRAQKSG